MKPNPNPNSTVNPINLVNPINPVNLANPVNLVNLVNLVNPATSPIHANHQCPLLLQPALVVHQLLWSLL
jgi:hypothetical protein